MREGQSVSDGQRPSVGPPPALRQRRGCCRKAAAAATAAAVKLLLARIAQKETLGRGRNRTGRRPLGLPRRASLQC
eukprot:365564-Chlamydomonas_euryale.AAC.2